MRMNQDERRFDFHGLGAALKRAREEKGWTQAYVAELVDRDSRTIMNIENKGWRRNQPFNWRLAKNRTCCKASVFCIRYFRNYLYLHSGKRKFPGTFYSSGCRNRLIKSIYLQKCTAPDKLRTVHFFFLNFTISQFFI